MSMTRVARSDVEVSRWVIVLANSGTVLLAFGAFWLSYLSLQDLARLSGLPRDEAWVWPLIVDGVIIEATIAVVALRRARSSARAFAWTLLCVGASVSVVANITHAVVAADARVSELIAAVVSSVPPLVLLAMTHLTVLLTSNTPSAAQQATEHCAEREPVSRPQSTAVLDATRARSRKSSAGQPARKDRRVQALQLHHVGTSRRQIAAQLGVHPTTVGRWLHAPDITKTRTEDEKS